MIMKANDIRPCDPHLLGLVLALLYLHLWWSPNVTILRGEDFFLSKHEGPPLNLTVNGA